MRNSVIAATLMAACAPSAEELARLSEKQAGDLSLIENRARSISDMCGEIVGDALPKEVNISEEDGVDITLPHPNRARKCVIETRENEGGGVTTFVRVSEARNGRGGEVDEKFLYVAREKGKGNDWVDVYNDRESRGLVVVEDGDGGSSPACSIVPEKPRKAREKERADVYSDATPCAQTVATIRQAVADLERRAYNKAEQADPGLRGPMPRVQRGPQTRGQ